MILTLFTAVYLYIFLQMSLVWWIAKKIRNPGLIDFAWEIGLSVTGFVFLYSQKIDLKNICISLILFIWGARLGWHMYLTRIKPGIVEKRYIDLSKTWTVSTWLGFFIHFQLQGLFMFIISSTFYFASTAPLSYIDIFALLFCVLGIFGEMKSDDQLKAFKNTHPGQVCNVGLWRYSRHPNLFCECLVWFGFGLSGLTANWGIGSLIAPMLTYLFMLFGTIPLTEKGSLISRGEAYRNYQKTTPIFFPWKF